MAQDKGTGGGGRGGRGKYAPLIAQAKTGTMEQLQGSLKRASAEKQMARRQLPGMGKNSSARIITRDRIRAMTHIESILKREIVKRNGA